MVSSVVLRVLWSFVQDTFYKKLHTFNFVKLDLVSLHRMLPHPLIELFSFSLRTMIGRLMFTSEITVSKNLVEFIETSSLMLTSLGKAPFYTLSQ